MAKYLSHGEGGEGPEEHQLQKDSGGGADMPQQHQAGGQPHQSLGIYVEGRVVVAQGTTEGPQRNALGLVTCHVRLQRINTPSVVENIEDEVDVRSVISVIGRHFFVLLCSLGFVFVFFFIVSKERVTKNYNNAKERKTRFVSPKIKNFRLMNLWSINFGSWDLAADKSAIEIIKITSKESK